MPGWPETRDTLLARLRDPDDLQAWSEFSTLYHPLIFRFALRRGLQEADALDITQQVLWAVARAAESWTSVEGKPRFRSWLATVARNATLNLLQRDGKNRASGKSSVWEFMKTIPAPDEDLETSWTTERRKQIFPPGRSKKRSHCFHRRSGNCFGEPRWRVNPLRLSQRNWASPWVPPTPAEAG